MKHIFAFESIEEYKKHESLIQRFSDRLNGYQEILEENFALTEAPKAIVWTSAELATSIFSEIPIPAFTNKDTIYITPDLTAWRKLMIEQLDGKDLPHIQHFYENFSENLLFTIVGHELTHHSDLFVDEFEEERDDSIWFEEGMCEYLPKKLLLSESEFNGITAVETELVEVFTEEYGLRSLDEFGSASYKGSLSSIMFDYWRSFLAIKFLVEERYQNDVRLVFEDYRKWHDGGRKTSLSSYFNIEQMIEKIDAR